MSNKIGNIEQNYGAVDFSELHEDLKLAEYEDMNPEEFELALYKENGTIPKMVKKASAEKFGLRHAYFDIWQPSIDSKSGVWVLQKDQATGEEFIVKKAES